MNSTYAQKSSPVQKAADTKAASVLDSSAQSVSLQRKADMANNATQRAESPRPNNTGMPDNLKAGIESLSGFSMDNVRVHYNSSKPATVQALAYTQGTDIHVAPGQEKCLPHEAWHVAQQMAGRVSPTTNINGMPVNDNAALEHEADVMGEKAVQCKKNENLFVGNYRGVKEVAQCARETSQPNELGITKKGLSDKDKFGIDIGRDHIIPYEFINDFIGRMSDVLSKAPTDKKAAIKSAWDAWVVQAVKTKQNNDSGSSENRESGSEVTEYPVVDLDLETKASLLWMPGNILISWKNRKLENTLFMDNSVIDRAQDAHEGFDEYALDIAAVNPELKELYNSTSELMSIKSDDPDVVIKILGNLKRIAEISTAYETMLEDWVTMENPSYNSEKRKKGKKGDSTDQSDKQYLSYYNPVPGFRVRDCGSFGNNCLLLSLGIGGDYASIRQSVRSYEIENLRYDRGIGGIEVLDTYENVLTSESSFLNPETLFPVLRRRGELYVDVWIYNLSTAGWVHWNGRNLRYNEEPHRSAYDSTSIFLLYNGVNHYQRLVYKG